MAATGVSFHEESFSAASTQNNTSDNTSVRGDNMLAGEVSGLEHINNATIGDVKLHGLVEGDLEMRKSKVSDKTAYDVAEKVENSPNTCSKESCLSPDSTYMLKCCDCKLSIHFSCTNLPRYQLYLYVKTSRKFSCEVCSLIPADWAPDYIAPATSSPSHPSSPSSVSLEQMKSLMSQFEKSVCTAVSGLSRDNVQLKISGLEHERADLIKSRASLEREVGECRKLIDKLSQEADASNTRYNDLRAKLISDTDVSNSKIQELQSELSLLRSSQQQSQGSSETKQSESADADATSVHMPTEEPSVDQPADVEAKTDMPVPREQIPDVLYVGNSLSTPVNPGQLFAPKFTLKHTLEVKNLHGASTYIKTCDNIAPQNVVLHVLENNLSADTGQQVIDKLSTLVSDCKTRFGDIPIFVVEPIGRRCRTKEETAHYQESATYVRRNLHKVVPASRIVHTPELQQVKPDLFDKHGVHLRLKGTKQLCICLKRVVYPGALGMEYTEPLKRSPTMVTSPKVTQGNPPRQNTQRANLEQPAPKRNGPWNRNYPDTRNRNYPDTRNQQEDQPRYDQSMAMGGARNNPDTRNQQEDQPRYDQNMAMGGARNNHSGGTMVNSGGTMGNSRESFLHFQEWQKFNDYMKFSYNY